MINLTILGTFALSVGEHVAADLSTDKARALLVYLALESSRPHRREALAALLWPDILHESALNNLRQTLHRLRTALDRVQAGAGNALLTVSRKTVQLHLAQLAVDALTFTQSISEYQSHAHPDLARCDGCLARLTQAVALYQGELLAGFGVEDAAAFEEWLLLRRENLQHQALLALTHLADACERRGDYAVAHGYAERLLALDAYQEASHRQVMRLLARRGLINQAVAHYERCRRVLHDDLHVAPAAETVKLMELIRSGAFTQQNEPAGSTTPAPDKIAEKIPTPTAASPTSSPAHAWPLRTTPLLGRAIEQAQLRGLLMDPTCRLLTLLGPGGIGKTSLAIQVATDLLAHFSTGVYFVDLSAIRNPEFVITLIARVLAVRETGMRPLLARVKEALQDQPRLLLLDNFEQVSTAAGQITELLIACPRLQVLVTSRARLQLDTEHVFLVPPLALPALSPLPTLRQLAAAPAIALFIQRAQSVLPAFCLSHANAPAVAELCVYLDGLPLAIELAAARLQSFSVQALLAHLKRLALSESATRRNARLTLLHNEAPATPQRHRTLHNLIDWSYALLDPSLQRLFAQLAIFANGFTIQAAEAVCCGDAQNPTNVAPIITGPLSTGLDTLLEQSLIRQPVPADGAARFTMLQTIREYAWEQLSILPEYGQVQKRHALYYLALAEEAAAQLRSADATPGLGRLEADHDNLRTALEWSLTETDQPDIGLRLANALSFYWYQRGQWSDGRIWLERALAKQTAVTPLRARALLSLGEMHWAQGTYNAARNAYEEALLCFRTLQDQDGAASIVSTLGLVAREQGDATRARTLLEESLALFQQQENQHAVAWTLCSLGEVAVIEEDAAQATSLLEQSLALFHQQGDQRGVAWAYNHLGHVAQLRGEYRRATALHETNLSYFRKSDRNGAAWTVNGLASVALDVGDYEEATTYYTESLALFGELESKQGIAWSLAGLGGAAAGGGQGDRALRLWSAAETLRNAIGARPAPATEHRDQQAIAVQCNALDAAAFAQAWEEGRQISLAQAISYALTDQPPFPFALPAATITHSTTVTVISQPQPDTPPLEQQPSPAHAQQALEVQSALGSVLAATGGFSAPGHSDTVVTNLGAASASTGRPSPSAPLYNLPPQATALIGRMAELADLQQRLGDERCRLLTIVGAGGMGKTRLAQALAAGCRSEFAEGVVFVPLVAVSAADFQNALDPVHAALVDALGIALHGSEAPHQQIAAYLRAKSLLLILDNFEHLLDSVAVVSELLAQSPRLKILVTASTPLRLHEEWLFPLAGLDFPPPATKHRQAAPRPDIRRYSAVQLFEQRAQQVQPSFDLSMNERAAVHICQLVEGMPLGIELAAAWTRVMPCVAIVRQIEAGIDFLTSNERNIPARHRSLRAVFDHSWRLLTPLEQAVLQRLAVLHGEFTWEAAQVVAGATLPLLAELIDKSLLRVTAHGRYALQEQLRQYAGQRLHQSAGTYEQARTHHAGFYLNFVSAQERHLQGAGILDALAAMTSDLDNIRAAWGWAVEHALWPVLEPALEPFWYFYEIEGWYLEGEEALQRAALQLRTLCTTPAASKTQSVAQPLDLLLGRLLSYLGLFQARLGRYAQAEATLQESMTLVQQATVQSPRAKGFALIFSGALKGWQGAYAEAIPLLQESVDLLGAASDSWVRGIALTVLGQLHHVLGQYPEAEQLAQASCAIFDALGEQHYRIYDLTTLGGVALARGRYAQAAAYHQICLASRLALGDQAGIAFTYRELGEVERLQGNADQARDYYQQCLAIGQEIGFRLPVEQALWGLGCLAEGLGDYAGAQQSFQASRASNPGDLLANPSSAHPGWVAVGLGEWDAAATFFATVLKLAGTTQRTPLALDALVGLAYLYGRGDDIARTAELLVLVAQHPAVRQETQTRISRIESELAVALSSYAAGATPSDHQEQTLWQTVEQVLVAAPALR